jgi:hypothetical protein
MGNETFILIQGIKMPANDGLDLIILLSVAHWSPQICFTAAAYRSELLPSRAPYLSADGTN